jgi:hypothetical protein
VLNPPPAPYVPPSWGSPFTSRFVGTAIVPAGQSSPGQIDPSDVVVRPDGAIGIGYRYQAAGQASGQVAGAFSYHERGYLFFTNPADPSTLAGSRFTNGVFTVAATRGGAPIQIADTAPDRYTSGIQTVAEKASPVVSKGLRNLFGHTCPLTMGISPSPTSVEHSPATRHQTSLASRSRLRSTCRIRCTQRAPAAHHAPAYTITSFLPSRETYARPEVASIWMVSLISSTLTSI